MISVATDSGTMAAAEEFGDTADVGRNSVGGESQRFLTFGGHIISKAVSEGKHGSHVVRLGFVNRCRLDTEISVLVVVNIGSGVGFVVVLYLCEKAVEMDEFLFLHVYYCLTDEGL